MHFTTQHPALVTGKGRWEGAEPRAENREPTTKRMYLHTGMGVRALQPLSSCWFLSLELPNWQQGARAPILPKLLQAAK